MKELPTPTFPFSQLGLRAALWPAPSQVRTPASIPCRTGARRRRPHRSRRHQRELGAPSGRRPRRPAPALRGVRRRDGRAPRRRRWKATTSTCSTTSASTCWCATSATQRGDRHLPRADAGPGAARRQHLQRHRVRPDPPARPARAHGRAGPQLRARGPSPGRRDPGALGRAGRLHEPQQARHHDRLRQHPDVAQRRDQRRCGRQHLAPAVGHAHGADPVPRAAAAAAAGAAARRRTATSSRRR